VILACKDLADLRRASEWTEAARAWCEALPATTPYSQVASSLLGWWWTDGGAVMPSSDLRSCPVV
jgi:hypothetical protein